jgi:general secretion pathway protein D
VRVSLLAAVSMVACAIALSGCAVNRDLARARQADGLRDFDLAVAQYAKVVREHPTNQDARLGLERAKLRAADAHFARGRRLLQIGRYEDASLELQIATDLNPTNADAARDLRAARAAVRTSLAAPPEGTTPLELLLARGPAIAAAGHSLPDTRLPGQVITGAQATSRQLYLAIARMANLSVIFDAGFPDSPAPVALLTDMTARQALDAVARTTRSFYQVTGPNTITVVPDTPQKRLEYTEEAERVFFVQNANLTATLEALRQVSDIRSIAPIASINAIVARDTPARLQAAAEFLRAFDKAPAELVVDVEILEVDRLKLMEYGLQLASPSGDPAAPPSGIDGGVSIVPATQTADSIRNLTSSNVLLSGIPALYYRLLKTDTNTRTLANPHLRMSDGATARAEFGDQIPTPNTTVGALATGGVNNIPITTFTYRNIGVNIAVTPRVHPSDEVSLLLDIELSTSQGTGFGGLPTFGNRKVTTTLRLKDGETNILGGLIRDDERLVKDGFLSDVPGLGFLFGKTRKEATETDVVVMLTPHIVRSLSVTEDDLRTLKLSREGGGGAMLSMPPEVTPAAPKQ